MEEQTEVTQPVRVKNATLQRGLTNRHIQLIAIGGAIGTGLFMGSGKTISLAGPSIIFVYMIIGFVLFFVMRAMGELLLSNLEYKSFSDFAGDLLGTRMNNYPSLHILHLYGKIVPKKGGAEYDKRAVCLFG